MSMGWKGQAVNRYKEGAGEQIQGGRNNFKIIDILTRPLDEGCVHHK